MRLFLLIVLFAPFYLNAQIKYPKSFKLIHGESPAGRDDYYTDGKHKISSDTPFQADGMPENSTLAKQALADEYGIAFNTTKDNLFYGTGYSKGSFKYIIVSHSIAFILSSRINDESFSKYSKWLLSAIRKEIARGSEISFP